MVKENPEETFSFLYRFVPWRKARRRKSTVLILFLGVAVVLSSFTGVLISREIGLAAAPSATFAITPSTLKLAPGERADVLAVVRNTTQKVMRTVRLSGFANGGIAVAIEDFGLDSLAVDSSHAWTVHVGKSGSSPSSSGLCLKLDYTWMAANSKTPIKGVATATLDIEENAPDSVEKVAEVRTEASPATLEEKRPETAFLLIRNIAAVPILVESITSPSPPPDLTVQIPDLGRGISLAPQESRAFPIRITVGNAVQTGEHLLLLESRIHWEKWRQPFQGTLIAAQKLNVGVMGESDILKLLGVPTFFFLPGFLMVTLFMALWKYVSPKKALPLEPKSAEFWLAAVTLSLLAAPAYVRITDWFGTPRDYLAAYGMRDVFLVWIGSVGLATFVWLSISGTKGLMALWKTFSRERHTPSEKDTPVEALRKLARNGLGFSLMPVDVAAGDPAVQRRYFLLELGPEDRREQWILPPIIWKWTGQEADKAFRAGFMTQLDRTGDTNALADLIEKGCNGRVLEISWQYGAHPARIKADGTGVTKREDLGPVRILAEMEEN